MALALTDRDTPLLERAAALDALDAARQRRGRLVLVSGEAGVGKTALLRRFCERHADGARILWGDCDATFTLSPLGPLVDIAALTGGALAERVSAGDPPHMIAAELLAELNEPAIVVFEDAHWADEATLDVLRLLGRRIAGVPALLVASFRDDELDRTHPLRVALGELSRLRATDRVRLAPLSAAAVAELAAPHGVDAAELHQRTAGNPFFVTEVLAAGGAGLPATVRDAVLARVAPLSEPARRLLDAAAIVHGRVELSLLEALVGDAAGHLEECLSCGVIGPAGAGVVFRHELARVAVEGALTPDRRRDLHRGALAALAGADPARLAYHAEAAGDGEAALRFAPAAAERAAAAGAHREAAAQYARALRFAGQLPTAERATLHERRSYECYVADQHFEAAEELRLALACHRELGDRRAEGDLLQTLSNILWCPGRADEAEQAGIDAVVVLEPIGPGPELARAYANMASLAMNREDAAATYDWGARAETLALRYGDEGAAINAQCSVGIMEFLAHGAAERGRAERSLAQAIEADRAEDVLRAYSDLAWAAVRHREHALANEYLRAGTAYASDPGQDLWWVYLLGFQARSELDQGRWQAAAETAGVTVRRRRTSNHPVVLALSVTGRLRARRGDPDPWGPLDEALALTGPELQRVEPAATARTEAAWLAGDPARVAAESEAVLALAERCAAGWVAGELALWRRRAGVETSVAVALPEPIALELGDEPEAAAAAWEALGCPYEAALARSGSADVDAQRRAHDELLALGANAAAAVVARELRRHGVTLPRGPRAATRENPAQLTARELEVLALVAQGLRNRDIADRLFLSSKTVNHHVSAILSKLDARTRGEAAARASRLGLV